MMKKRGISSTKETNDSANGMDEEEENIEHDDEVATSSQRQSKRSHKAISYDDNEDEDLDDEGYDESESSNKKKNSRKANIPESNNRGMSKRDSGETTLEDFDFNGNDEEEEQENEQDGVIKNSSSSEAGQILVITVENFMCHRKLSVNFCRNVNFVTGQNGSGKSAIVAAIQLCLGGTAKNTGRGSSMKSLIREGSDGPAIINIKLLNEGPDAYRPDEYGDRIEVERKITKSGTSSYTMKSSSGKAICTDKKELDRMLTQFNISVTNPCCVLTQEDAKRFIKGKEKEKYDFFLKATGLHHTKETIEESEVSLIDAEKQSIVAKEQLDVTKVTVMKMKAEVEEVRELMKLEEDIKICKAKILWAEVYELDASMITLQRVIDKKEVDLADAKARLVHLEGEVSDMGDMEEVKTRIEAINFDMENCHVEIEGKRKLLNDKQRQVNNTKNGIDQLSRGKADHSKRLAHVRKEIRELQASALADSEGRERELLQEITNISSRLTDLDQRGGELRAHKAQLVNECNAQQESVNSMNQNQHRCSEDLQSLIQELNRHTNTNNGHNNGRGGHQNNQKALQIHSSMPKALEDISNTRFRAEVIGPLAYHINLKEAYTRLQEPVEKMIFKALTGFIVQNADDRHLLNEIFRKNNLSISTSIFIQQDLPRFQIHPILVDNDIAVVLDCISIERDIVFNCLIDQFKIDQIPVVKDEAEMDMKLIKFVNGRKTFIIDAIGKVVTHEGRVINIRYGNVQDEANQFPCKHLLSKDMKVMIDSLQQRIQSKKEELNQLTHDNHHHQQSFSILRKKSDENESHLRQINIQTRELVRKKQEYENELTDIQATKVIDTTDLEAEEQELIEAIEKIKTQIEEHSMTYEIIQNELKLYDRDKKLIENRKVLLLNELNQHEKYLEQYVDHHEYARRKVEKSKREVAEKEKVLSSATKDFSELSGKKEDKRQNALNKTKDYLSETDWDGSDIILKSNETIPKLESMIKAKQNKLDWEKRNVGITKNRTLESVIAKYEQIRSDYQIKESKYTNMMANIDGLKSDLKERRIKWLKALKTNSTIVKRHFVQYIEIKGWDGSLVLDHKERTLHLNVMTDSKDKNSFQSVVENLSGGERSFVTLSLLLALGGVIETPFRLMDEYDVFLDELSRKETLTQLQHFALLPSNLGRQLFIVTPNSLQDMIPTSRIKIQRLKAPERASARGPQQQIIA